MRYFDLLDDYLKPMPTIADSLRDRITDLEKQHKTLAEENTRLKSQNKVLLDENARLKNRVEAHNRRDATHLNTVNLWGESVKALEGDIIKKNRQIDSLQTKNANLEASNKTLNGLVSNLERQIDEKKREIESLKQMNHNLAASNEALQKLAYKAPKKPVTTDDLLKKLQDKPKPEPKISKEDEKTLNRFKELMGDVNGCSGEEIVTRFLGTCLTMAMEDELKN